MSENRFYLSSSPHFSMGNSTQKIMMMVLIALLPECIWGVVMFGLPALVTIISSVLSCVVFELLFQICTRQKVRISNLSACVTGVMMALVCPPSTPFWMMIIGGAVAMIIAKGVFGGIGSNVFNPALTGRAFLFISFPAVIGANFPVPSFIPEFFKRIPQSNIEEAIPDAVTGATPLAAMKAPDFIFDNQTIMEYLFGFKGGCIGEISIVLIAVSFLFLLFTKIIDWRAPLTFVLTVACGAFISGVAKNGVVSEGLNEVLLHLLTGGLAFGACFMVTDYATTPVTKPGRLIFGFGCGLITFLIRRFGGYPEGVMFSILIMNAVAPFLNNITGRMYGYGRKGHRRPKVQKITQEFDLSTAKERKEVQ